VPQDQPEPPDPLRARREAWEAAQGRPAAKEPPAARERQERLVRAAHRDHPDRRANPVQLARLDRPVLLALLGLWDQWGRPGL